MKKQICVIPCMPVTMQMQTVPGLCIECKAPEKWDQGKSFCCVFTLITKKMQFKTNFWRMFGWGSPGRFAGILQPDSGRNQT